jgi:hypothetical protein
MELKRQIIITGIKNKTQAKFFKDFKVGDVIELVYNLNGMYHGAPYITIVKNGEELGYNNALQLKDNISKFAYQEV